MKVKFVPRCLGSNIKQRVKEGTKFFDSIDDLKEFIVGQIRSINQPEKETVELLPNIENYIVYAKHWGVFGFAYMEEEE